MPYCSLQDTFLDHPKIRKLAKKAEIGILLARGCVVSIWGWCLRHYQDGIIPKEDTEDMETSIGWEGDPGRLVDSMIAVGLIDDHGNGELEVHNWVKHGGTYWEKRRKQVWRKKQLSRDLTGHPGTSGDLTSALFSSPLLSSKLVDSVNTNIQELVDTNRPPETGLDGAVQQVFARYKHHHPKSSIKKLPVMDEAHLLIRNALKAGFSVEDCCKAIDGYHNSAFHQGANDNNQKYLSLSLVFSDVSHIQKGIEMASSTLESSLLPASEVKEKLRKELLVRKIEAKKQKEITDGGG